MKNSGWPSSFTPEQLAEIRKVKVGRIVCDNSDDITTVPMNTFMKGDHMRNPFVEVQQSPFSTHGFNKMARYQLR
ncbi:chorion peroxidase [Caerostris extrusa]|uniref:Chorion peroxidase n=1 Tax=Caerostris extrusa TaxID=172846 RepID=A0AAV4X882_CAEEX|nr:chorion peroxidase [Caerostris extrusa]